MLEKVTPSGFFLLVALFFGLCMLLITPPFQVPDEFNHFYRAYQVSEGTWLAQRTQDRVGGELPASLAETGKPFRSLPFRIANKTSLPQILAAGRIPLKEQCRSFTDFPNTALYAPVCYAPQALAIFLARSAGANPLYMLYWGRLSALLFWTMAVYVSIRIIPVHKWLLALLALLPTSVFINSSLSADVVTNSLSFLILALAIKHITAPYPLRKWDAALIFLLTGLLSLCKGTYFLLFILFLLIPRSRFSSRQAHRLHITLLPLFAAGVFIVWFLWIGRLYISYDAYDSTHRLGQQLVEGVNPVAQLKYIVFHPVSFLLILSRSYFFGLKSTIASYIGKFGWAEVYIPLWTIIFLIILLLLTALSEPRPVILKREQRRVLTVTAFFIVLQFSVMIYLSFCPVGSPEIYNLQGRYFIPVIPLLLFALPHRPGFRFPLLRKVIVPAVPLSLAIGVLTLLYRYYF